LAGEGETDHGISTQPRFRDDGEFLFHRTPGTSSSQTWLSILHRYIFASPCPLASCDPSFGNRLSEPMTEMPQSNCNSGRPT
jgi:hypothetical protein